MKKFQSIIFAIVFFTTLLIAQNQDNQNGNSNTSKSASLLFSGDNPWIQTFSSVKKDNYREQFQTAFQKVVESAKNDFKGAYNESELIEGYDDRYKLSVQFPEASTDTYYTRLEKFHIDDGEKIIIFKNDYISNDHKLFSGYISLKKGYIYLIYCVIENEFNLDPFITTRQLGQQNENVSSETISEYAAGVEMIGATRKFEALR